MWVDLRVEVTMMNRKSKGIKVVVPTEPIDGYPVLTGIAEAHPKRRLRSAEDTGLDTSIRRKPKWIATKDT
jgi:hypothetical protein